MRDMSDVMLGSLVTYDRLTLDARYAYFTTAPDRRDPVHELGLKLTADLPAAPLTVRAAAGIYAGTTAGGDYLYVETTLEPAWRGDVAGRPVGLSVPLVVGLSGSNYYSTAVGYLSPGVSGSVALPAPKGCGSWFLNASCNYLYLAADNLRSLNDGRSSAVVGKLGVAVAY